MSISALRGCTVTALLAVPALILLPSVASAQILGSSVFGQMLINSNPPNYFDPANGFVPNGYLNKTQGPNVTIVDPGVEFGYQDGANTDSADFTNTGVTLSDVSVSTSVPIKYVFTDTAFSGLTLQNLSNTFPSLVSATLVGDVLTLSAPSIGSPGTYTSVYSLLPPTPPNGTPEPGSVALLAGVGFSSILVLRRNRKR